MVLAKLYGCLAVSIFHLILLVDQTTVCYCLGSNLEDTLCKADVVIRGPFMNVEYEGDMKQAIHEFKVNENYKTPSYVVGERVNMYTDMTGTSCVFKQTEPNAKQEYLIGGSFAKHNARISTCSFIKPWNNLTPKEIKSVENLYFNCR